MSRDAGCAARSSRVSGLLASYGHRVRSPMGPRHRGAERDTAGWRVGAVGSIAHALMVDRGGEPAGAGHGMARGAQRAVGPDRGRPDRGRARAVLAQLAVGGARVDSTHGVSQPQGAPAAVAALAAAARASSPPAAASPAGVWAGTPSRSIFTTPRCSSSHSVY